MRTLTMAKAIREAQDQLLANDPRTVIIGCGVGDPKGVFGTTPKALVEKYPNRVFDSPVSENGVTGVCIGAAIAGMRPIHVHQRMDFMLYAADQIINNAAKWHSMFGGNAGTCPLVIRCVIGRGWGQGNQHSQDLTHIFRNTPGLTVCIPSNAYDAKGLLMAAHKDPNPVIFVEHRWLHETTSTVPKDPYELSYDDQVIREGDREIWATGYGVVEALKAAEFLSNSGVELRIVEKHTFRNNKSYPPSTHGLIEGYYTGFMDIIHQVIGRELPEAQEYYDSIKSHDQPNADFKGPF